MRIGSGDPRSRSSAATVALAALVMTAVALAGAPALGAQTEPDAPVFQWQVGLAAGPAFPLGDAETPYGTGIDVLVPIAWRPSLESRWGVRLDAAYTRLSGDEHTPFIGLPSVSVDDLEIFSLTGDLVGRWRPTERATVYALGGVGYAVLPDYEKSPFTTGIADPDDGGLTWVLGAGWAQAFDLATVFVEARYRSVGVDPEALTWAPVLLGVSL